MSIYELVMVILVVDPDCVFDYDSWLRTCCLTASSIGRRSFEPLSAGLAAVLLTSMVL